MHVAEAQDRGVSVYKGWESMPKSIQSLRRSAALARANPYDGRTALKQSAVDAALGAVSVEPAAGAAALSRGQRKRSERRLHKLGKWESSSVTKALSKKGEREEKESRMMSELEKTLKAEGGAAVVIKPASASSGTTNKMKREIALREAERMKAVQEHPAFVSNPIAAVHTHLQQMLALRQQSQKEASGVAAAATAAAAAAAAAAPSSVRATSSSKSHEKRLRKKERGNMMMG